MINFRITDLHFHRDYDGVIAAAMIYANLSDPPALHATQYSPTLGWLEKNLGSAPAVVDFLYHPSALLWIDHHKTTFLDPSHASGFSPDSYHVLDINAPSCPHLIHQLPWFSQSDHWTEYIKWSDIIDSAQYKNPFEANDILNPHLMLSRLIGELDNPTVIRNIVSSITTMPIDAVLKQAPIRELNNKLLKLEIKLRKALMQRIVLVGSTAILDQSDFDAPYHRYIAYERFPQIYFGIGIYRSGKNFIVSVGENPWNRTSKIDLGALCQEYGGGGRKSTAGIPTDSIEKGRVLATTVSSRLNSLI
jgi:hypothetical protein